MITLTWYNTNRKLYLDEKQIVKVLEDSNPWTTVLYVDDEYNEKNAMVMESPKHIGKLLVEAMQKSVAKVKK